ncbi:hypothetical protein ZIOFF_026070 [Zingiber officinale]|uniref:Uncharacterized protein n=1 Tax=Zingiber officinale TaxID=94328 RepID=A0A8J5LEI2_ZINOF|nr:hypothetical protein ZIOFF_026070 [Zingiber officinale]
MSHGLEVDSYRRLIDLIYVSSCWCYLAVAVPFVCKSWYRASLDPSCWRRLNFRSLDFTPWSPFSRAFALRYRLHSPLSFSAFLRFALHRSRGVVDQLAFPLSSVVSIHDLAYASVKCLRLKALALPDNLMLEDDLRIPELVWRWKDLEHLEMETKPSSFLEAVAEIGRNCPRFVGLKVRGLIRREDAKAMARCLPELKHLELSKSYLTKDELLVVIGGCRKLETLTVKDCLGFQADDEILKLVSHIERFEHEGSTLVYSYTCSNIGSRIFSDVAGDVTIYVDGQSFLLHKFPLVSRSGKIWKMVVESREPDLIPVVHALLSLLLHVCSFVIKNLRPGIQIAGSFKAAILILCCNTFHVAYSFCLHGEACQDDPKHHCPDMNMWFLDKASIFRRAAEDDFLNIWDYEGHSCILAYEIWKMASEFTNLKYSRVEIDEVRFEWAECMLDYI